tara:strand:+ start:1885 stop:2505 length:621 start_codon:yes stop_codon:yes gene_type:complete
VVAEKSAADAFKRSRKGRGNNQRLPSSEDLAGVGEAAGEAKPPHTPERVRELLESHRKDEEREAKTKANRYGSRPDGTRKSTGFLGSLQLPDGGVATEFSTQSDAVKVDGKRIDFPSLVPTLTEKERKQMVEDVIPNKKPIPESIMQKSIQYAKGRMAEGKGVFYDPDRDVPHQDIERSERDVPPRDFHETRSMGIEKASRKRFRL